MLPRFRSKSVRKIARRVRAGKAPFRYKRKLGRMACCSICGSKLSWGRAKSMRRPSRIFSGALCSRCSFEMLKFAGKIKGGQMKLEDVDLGSRKFVAQLVKK